MNRRIVIRPEAERDLRQQAFYFQETASLAIAERFLDKIDSALSFLSTNPAAGSPCDFSPQLPLLRRLIVRGFENYLIFYSSTNDTIEIVRVLHGARDILRLFE